MRNRIDITHTIYHRVGRNENHPDGLVGVSIPPLPSCSRSEIVNLASQLLNIANDMGDNTK
jgi:hypothetical protein